MNFSKIKHLLYYVQSQAIARTASIQGDAARLQRRSPLIVSGAIVGVVGVIHLIASLILLRSFLSVEQQAVEQNIQKLSEMISNELQEFLSTVQDYAWWDDTYRYIQDHNSEYIDSNYSSATFLNLNVDVVAIMDSSGALIFGRRSNSSSGQISPLTPQMQQQITATNAVWLDSASKCQSGLVKWHGSLMLLGVCPITTSEGTSPARGSLIMGRQFDADTLTKLSKLTHLLLEMQLIDQASLPSHYEQAKLALLGGESGYIQAVNARYIAGYLLLRDIDHQPTALMQLRMQRVIFRQGLLSWGHLTLLALGMASLFGIVIWVLLQKLAEYLAERDRIQQALHQEKELAQVTLHSLGDAVITAAIDGCIGSLNHAAEKLLGWQAKEVLGLPLASVFRLVDETTYAAMADPLEQLLLQGSRLNHVGNHSLLVTRSGHELAIDGTIALIRSREGEMIGAVLVFRDVTQARTMARQLSWQASYDALTGLLNRHEFEKRLEQAVTLATQDGLEHSLCFLDLDRFKIVNDTCGHVAGDELLRQIGGILQSQVRKTDTVARMGGDEFAVLLYRCSISQAQALAQAICESVQDFRFVWQDKVFSVGVSIGMVAITPETPVLHDVLTAADAACYVAKNRGRGRVHLYKIDDHDLTQHRGEMQWVNRLTTALEHNQFSLYAQAIAPIKTSSIVGECYEVLLRLVDDQGNIIPPGAFLPAAERYNLMARLDRWVVRTLFSRLSEHYQQAWARSQREGCLCLYTINLSGDSINDEHFVTFLEDQFAQYQVPPQVICFEITETVAIASLSRAMQFIQQLKALGCHFALDDFGCGMSSLAYLKNLPVDYLKIAGELVNDIVENPVSLAMVEAIQRISCVMGIQTIAEFVTDDDIREELATIGVNFGQGYGIDRPQPLLIGHESKPQMHDTIIHDPV